MKKVFLIILDGWGLAPAWGGNAIEMADTPNIDQLMRRFPHISVKAAEEAVGLPIHEPGNSEVGHLNLGCGQVVRQNLPGISQEIKEESFFQNSAIKKAFNHAGENNSNLHFMGLVSDGGVHSHIDHLAALLDFAQKEKFNSLYIHVFTDGRDTNQMDALSYVSALKEEMRIKDIGRIESIIGRYWAMDRDRRWDRTQKAYNLLTQGVGAVATSPEVAISESYRQNVTDEFINPTAIIPQGQKFIPIQDNDSIIFFNFRADRAKQLTQAFCQSNFKGFNRTKFLKNIFFVNFAFVEDEMNNPNVHPAFTKLENTYPLAKKLSENNLDQFHIGETEKYAHVTFFFNGGQEKPFLKEERLLIPSPKVATYDLKPEMSAPEITNAALSRINHYLFTVLNFANGDMVGHTGNFKATVRACEAVDQCLVKLVNFSYKNNFATIITADHGNAEQMIDADSGEPYTEHTINPVPFILISNDPVLQRPLRPPRETGYILADVAPTILEIMGIEKPPQMTGESLLSRTS